jgi:hypothetical protein
MHDLERQVSERTQRLLDMAEGIRQERRLRDGTTEEPEDAIAMALDDGRTGPERDAGGCSMSGQIGARTNKIVTTAAARAQ